MLNVIQINALKLRIVRNFVIIINYYEKERKLFTMKKENNKKSASALIGAAFLMATSAIGPGFLTQTGKFTDSLHGSFGFVILISVILAAIVQLNVWRVLCVSGMRGQDVANKVLPGLGYVIAFLVVAGGLVFNIGNVGGGALGFNTLLGIPTTVGYFIAGAIAIIVFLSKNALNAMDNLTKILGGIMILVIFIVILIVQPPVGNTGVFLLYLFQIINAVLFYSIRQIGSFFLELPIQLLSKILIQNAQYKGTSQYQDHC